MCTYLLLLLFVPQFCALSSISEYLPGNMEHYVTPTGGKRKDESDLTPVNDHIAPLDKLEMALQLSKALAVMHGHRDGVIANVDVKLEQFCRAPDGRIKLFDFSRAGEP